VPPSYARAGVARALSGGLNNIIGLLMAKQADEDAQELAAYRQNEARKAQMAAELAQPDVVPVEQALRDYDAVPESLRAVATADQPGGLQQLLQFEQPSREVPVPGGEPIAVQAPPPEVTALGNVRDSGITRALDVGRRVEDASIEQRLAQARRDEAASGLARYLSDEQQAFLRAGVTPPRITTSSTAGGSREVRNVTPNQALDILTRDPEWQIRSPEEQIREANRLATIDKLPGGSLDVVTGGREPIESWRPTAASREIPSEPVVAQPLTEPEVAEARSLVANLRGSLAETTLAEAGYTSEEIRRILSGR